MNALTDVATSTLPAVEISVHTPIAEDQEMQRLIREQEQDRNAMRFDIAYGGIALPAILLAVEKMQMTPMTLSNEALVEIAVGAIAATYAAVDKSFARILFAAAAGLTVLAAYHGVEALAQQPHTPPAATAKIAAPALTQP